MVIAEEPTDWFDLDVAVDVVLGPALVDPAPPPPHLLQQGGLPTRDTTLVISLQQ